MKNKKLVSTILFSLGIVLTVFSIFCFFGVAIVVKEGGFSLDGPTMFTYMFGGDYHGQPCERLNALTALFVLEIFVIVIDLVIAYMIFGKKSESKKVNIAVLLASVLTLITVIMSFCTKAIMINQFGSSDYASYYHLGGGAISYSILGIVGIIANIAGIVIGKKAQ